LTPPWLATHWAPAPWLRAVAGAFSILVVGSMGLWLTWLVRPRDRTADLLTGLASGLIAGIAAFLCGVGWAVVLALVVVPSLPDIFLFDKAVAEKAAVPAGPADEVARLDLAEVVSLRYPDLRALPPRKRVGAFVGKIVTDQ